MNLDDKLDNIESSASGIEYASASIDEELRNLNQKAGKIIKLLENIVRNTK